MFRALHKFDMRAYYAKQKINLACPKYWLLLVVKELGRSVKQTELFAEYAQCVHKDCILGTYNTWCEVIHMKIKLY